MCKTFKLMALLMFDTKLFKISVKWLHNLKGEHPSNV